MASRTRFTCIVLSTVVATGALFSGSAPASADPSVSEQPGPDPSAVLRMIASTFGDSNGHLVVRKRDGSTVVLAHLVRDFEIYTAGDRVADEVTLAFCHEDRGELSACEVLLSDPGGETRYECGMVDSDNSTYCSCDAGFDCISMFADGVCEGGWECNDEFCTCDF
jgi:hypothetical protein